MTLISIVIRQQVEGVNPVEGTEVLIEVVLLHVGSCCHWNPQQLGIVLLRLDGKWKGLL